MDPSSTRVLHTADPNAAIDIIRRDGRRVVTFAGFSGAGYEEPALVEHLLRTYLDRLDPCSTIICAGATPDGIGAVYPLAKERGFETIGIVSSAAERDEVRFSDDVDRIYVIEDDLWGGLLDDGVTLSPTSTAMVGAADEFIAIGGGAIARDEVTAALQAKKEVRYEAADMNHGAAAEQALRKGEEQPVQFKGVVDGIFGEG